MVSIDVVGGSTEIGGNKFFIEHKGTKIIRIGSLEIEMIPVDHSLPDACGYIIYTYEGNIVYTGDIRFHGSNGDLSKIFVEERKHNWLERFGIQSFLAHASGHASADEIKKMVEMINPQYLIPIHTQHRNFFSVSSIT